MIGTRAASVRRWLRAPGENREPCQSASAPGPAVVPARGSVGDGIEGGTEGEVAGDALAVGDGAEGGGFFSHDARTGAGPRAVRPDPADASPWYAWAQFRLDVSP